MNDTLELVLRMRSRHRRIQARRERAHVGFFASSYDARSCIVTSSLLYRRAEPNRTGTDRRIDLAASCRQRRCRAAITTGRRFPTACRIISLLSFLLPLFLSNISRIWPMPYRKNYGATYVRSKTGNVIKSKRESRNSDPETDE